MLAPPLPHDEVARLAELRRYRILDTPSERTLDRIIGLAAHALDVPIVVISLVDERRLWTQACLGIETRGGAREVSFCGHAILSDEPLVIPDATLDVRFADNPHVTGAPFIRAYAGAPLVAPSGHRIGTLCVIDTRARQFGFAQLHTLAELAAIVIDELELRRTRDELAEQRRVLLAVLDSCGEGIAVTDAQGEFVFLNPAGQRMLGYGPDEPQKREAVRNRAFHGDGVTPFALEELPAKRALAGIATDGLEMCLQSPDRDTPLFLSITGRPVRDERNAITGSVLTFSDVTALNAARTELAKQATTDVLTGIPNHRAFRQRLELLVAEGRRGRSFALVLCDVDHFKRFNDDHGHQMGDRVLAAVAGKLASRVRKTDLAARYGGEEFAVLLTDVGPELAATIAEELRAGVAGLDLPHKVTASFGVAPFGEQMDGDALVAAADAALYRAKHAGRNRVERAS